MEKTELLSPAGNFDSLKMAVMAGANAVYFGAKNFNARAKAENFGANLKDAVAFAHMYGTKVYLTLNTLVENNEIYELVEVVNNALKANVDAFIVQDFGVVNIIKNCFPQAVIHASTQMAVNNYLGAIKAQQMGIKRVVLSRETSLEDVKLIKQNTNLEIEYFIQGALCVCFSGNCYMSSYLFSKSGNRGECLQPCRLFYKAILKGKEIGKGYLLSAKDLNMSKRLKDLMTAGVDSFKIEGRLRRPAYVFETTKTYRKIIDNNFNVCENDQITLKKAFNRGDFTEGYLNGNANIIDEKIQNNKGYKIGKVVAFNAGKKFNIVTIKTKIINKGDGLKFIKDGIEKASISAIDVKQKNNLFEITTTSIIPKDSDVYLILDSKQEEADLKFIRKLPLDIKLIAMANKPMLLKSKLTYGLNSSNQILSIEVEGDICQNATKIPLDYISAKQSLEKLNDTNFFLNNFELETDNVFVTKKQLNDIRRNLLEKINQYFLKEKNVIFNENYLKEINFKNYLKNNNITIEIGENLNSKADFFVVKPKDFTKFDFKKISHKNAFLYIPSFLPNKDFLIIKNILENNPNLGVYAQNIGALNFNRKTILGAKLNIKNIFGVKELINENVVLIETSPELTEENFNILNNAYYIPMIKSNLNNFELITLLHCPIKTLYKNTCSNCKFSENIHLQMQNGKEFALNRYKIVTCYFTLQSI